MPCFSNNRDVATDTVTVVGDSGSIGEQFFTVTVPTGKVPLSAGFHTPYTTSCPLLRGSYPNSAGTGWTFSFQNPSITDRSVDLYVVYEDA